MSGGRPKASEEAKKGVTIRFRCTSAEEEELHRRAGSMSLSAWMRFRLLGANADAGGDSEAEGAAPPQPADGEPNP